MKKINFTMFLLTSCSFNNDSTYWNQNSNPSYEDITYNKNYTLEEYDVMLNQYNKKKGFPDLN